MPSKRRPLDLGEILRRGSMKGSERSHSAARESPSASGAPPASRPDRLLALERLLVIDGSRKLFGLNLADLIRSVSVTAMLVIGQVYNAKYLVPVGFHARLGMPEPIMSCFGAAVVFVLVYCALDSYTSWQANLSSPPRPELRCAERRDSREVPTNEEALAQPARPDVEPG